MEKLKFLIIIAALFIAEGAMAVTLPTSSYSPVPSSFETGDYTNSTGTIVHGSYSALAASYSACEPGSILGYTGDDFKTCEECCEKAEPNEDLRGNCISYCYGEQEALSPIEAPTWLIIIFSACVMLTGGIKALRHKNDL